jgi:hypothetical protein
MARSYSDDGRWATTRESRARQDWKAARAAYHDDAFDDHGFFKGPPDQFLAHIEKLHAQQDPRCTSTPTC